jgi:hypothetical protein
MVQNLPFATMKEYVAKKLSFASRKSRKNIARILTAKSKIISLLTIVPS